MRITSALLFGLLVLIPATRADDPKPQALDIWDAAFLQGQRAGFVRTTIAEVGKDDKKRLAVSVDLNLNIKRFNDTIQLRAQTGNVETLDGKVTGTFYKQFLGQKQQMFVKGTVEGKQLKLVLDDTKQLEPAPWDDAVV